MSLVRKQFTISESASFECWIYVIRGVDGRPDEFWFKGHDVAEFLGYAKPRNAISDNVLSEWRRQWRDLKGAVSPGGHVQAATGSLVTSPEDDVITPSNWQPHTVFISEPGLYALVTRSKKPEAVRFTKWVYEEVLPSLRRSGTYNATQTEGSTSTPTASRDAALLLLQKDMEIQKLRYDNQLSEKDREIERQRYEKDREIERQRSEIERRESQSRELQAKFDNERLTMHYRHVTVHCGEYRNAESKALEVPAKYAMAIMNPIDYCRFKSPKPILDGSVRSYECNTLDCNYMLNDIPLPC